MNIRNRIKELRTVSPEDVAPNPRNWRAHPQNQRDALRGVLAQVGIAAPVIAYETPEGLTLIDGHERMTVGVPFPCVILDVTEEEADVLLATFDPIGAMAETNRAKLEELLRTTSLESASVALMLNQTLNDAIGKVHAEKIDPEEVWEGMPEFKQEDKTAWKTLGVHFHDATAMAEFSELVGQKITEKTTFIWHPKQERQNYMGIAWSSTVEGDDEP